MFLPLFVSLINLIFGLDEAEIVFAGDAMQHQAQLDAARTSDGLYDYSECFSEIAPFIQGADYAVVNLETPIGDRNYSGYPCFNAPASFAKALKDAGFSLMLTANNHTLDRHDAGLRATIDHLDALGISHIGTYNDMASRMEALPFVKNISGIKVGFLNYTYGTNGITVRGNAVVDYINRETIISDIEALRQCDAEIICVAVHWGIEYNQHEDKSQRLLADFLVNQGVDLIIGGHPHVVQPMEVRYSEKFDKNVLVAYSLGNFISNMKTRDTRGGALLSVRLCRGRDGIARFYDAVYKLVFTVPADKQSNFKVVPAKEYKGHWSNACNGFVKSASQLFESYNIGVKSIDD